MTPASSYESTREEFSSETDDSSDLPHLPPSGSPGPSASGQGAISTSSETASYRKLSPMLQSLSPTGEVVMPLSETDCAGSGVRLVQLEKLHEAAQVMKCPACESHVCFHERCECRRGLVTYIAFRCSKCCWEKCTSNPCTTSSSALNAKAILASRLAGIGRHGTEVLCGMLGLPPPVSGSSYHAKTKKFVDT